MRKDEDLVIARTWRGWTKSRDVDAYRKYIGDTWIKDCKSSTGNAGAYIFTRVIGDRAEVITLSLWDSEDSLKQFFGGDVLAPHFYPDDEKYVVEGDERVAHYEVD